LFPPIKIFERFSKRLEHQLVARSEVFVKAANAATGFLHYVSDSDSLQSPLTETLGGNGNDFGMSDGFFRP
jgi:hypothetical protein